MLTDTICKNAKCPEDKARMRLTDSGGLYLEVAPNGSKRWFWKYIFCGKEKRLALGSYMEPESRKAAVSLVMDLLAEIDRLRSRLRHP